MGIKMNLKTRVRAKIDRLRILRAKATAKRYVERHPSLGKAIKGSKDHPAIGVSVRDSVLLYSTILRLKPKMVLECGTGKSTHVIAQAMLDVHGSHEGLKLISMEQDEGWAKAARNFLPEEYESFVDIVLSDVETDHHAYLIGTCYKDVPELPYDFVYVDGPKQHIDGVFGYSNMDFVRVVKRSEKPVHALIDNRKASVMAYMQIFGFDKVTMYRFWGTSYVEGVSQNDLVIDDARKNISVWSFFPKDFGTPDVV